MQCDRSAPILSGDEMRARGREVAMSKKETRGGESHQQLRETKRTYSD
jgi:hypothetical protein